MACRSMQTLPKLWKSCSSIWVSSSLIPPEVGVAEPGCGLDAEAARTVETRDETSEVGVAEPVVADDKRPVMSITCEDRRASTGVALPSSRGPRGVSDRSVSRTGLAGRSWAWRWRSSGDVVSFGYVNRLENVGTDHG